MRYLKLLLLASSLGAGIAFLLTFEHLKSGKFLPCSIGNCDLVNSSKYSEIFGIPVAFLGFQTYVSIFILVSGIYYKKGKAVKILLPITVILSFFALLFSLYLTYIEFFVLKAVCIWCLLSASLIAFIFFLSLYSLKKIPYLVK